MTLRRKMILAEIMAAMFCAGLVAGTLLDADDGRPLWAKTVSTIALALLLAASLALAHHLGRRR